MERISNEINDSITKFGQSQKSAVSKASKRKLESEENQGKLIQSRRAIIMVRVTYQDDNRQSSEKKINVVVAQGAPKIYGILLYSCGRKY